MNKNYGLDSWLDFGEHTARRLREVIDDDPTWVWWALEEMMHFSITPDAYDYLVGGA